MADWKHHISTHFSACRLIANAHDHCRHREVKLWLVPNEWENVGVSDGVDAWIAPVSASIFSVNVLRLIQDFQKGIPFPKSDIPSQKIKRVPLLNQPRQRVRLLVDTPAPKTSRVILKA